MARVTAVMWVQSLAWELLHARGEAKKTKKKKKKKKKKNKKKKPKQKNPNSLVVPCMWQVPSVNTSQRTSSLKNQRNLGGVVTPTLD